MTIKQKQLILCWFDLLNPEDVDGIWGNKSEAATRRLQKGLGITEDGIFGQNTAGESLNAMISGADLPDAVANQLECNSSLVVYTRISPNSNNPRNHVIDTITIHHMAGDLSIEALGADFADPDRQGSSNYGIGSDGRIGMYVEEANRSWCSDSRENDHRAITIEVANDSREPDWHVSDAALESLIALCVDICQRYNIPELRFTGDKTGNLTMHKWFAATQCPGPYLESKFPYIAEEVNKRLRANAEKETTSEAEPVPEVRDLLYCVQLGAFRVRSNAERQLEQVKAAGFEDAFITTKEER